MIELIRTGGMTRKQWLLWRRAGIGGSDVAAIMGVNPYKGAYAVYLEKVDEGEPVEEAAGEPAHWGNVLEPVVAAEFALRTDLHVGEVGAIYTCEAYPWLRANIDRWVFADPLPYGKPKTFLECKTASAYKSHEWMGGAVPESYRLQVQTYLAVTGFEYAYIACLIGGQTFVYQRIERDEATIKAIAEATYAFWTRVECRTPPDVDGSRGTTDALDRQRNPYALAPTELDPGRALDAVTAYRRAKLSEAEAKAQAGAATNELKVMLGDAAAGYVMQEKVAGWVETTRETLDLKRARKELGELALAALTPYLKVTKSRRFTVHGTGDE